MILRNCLTCKKEFKIFPSMFKKGAGKYCSYPCRCTSLTVNCLQCNKEFKTTPYRIKINCGKYCSRKCYIESEKGRLPWNTGKKGCFTPATIQKFKQRASWNKGKKLSEEFKEKIRKTFTTKRRQQNRDAMRGKNNPAYIDGRTPFRKIIRQLFQYSQWRNYYFERDNYTCTECGRKNGNGKTVILQVDHYPKTFAQILKENNIQSIEDAINCKELWSLSNGRTLCLDCHKKETFKRY